MIQIRPAAAAFLALALAACQHEPTAQDTPGATLSTASDASIATTEASLVAANEQAGHAFGPEISAEDFSAHIRVLASDDFGGRQPGSAGEDKTVAYLREQFLRLGLQPGNGDSFFQTVPMVETKTDTTASKLQVSVAGKAHAMAFGEQMVMGSRSGKADVDVKASPMVFVGYGVNAPEAGWNDYKGLRRPSGSSGSS